MMQMTGEFHLEASKEEVWRALNDTEVLKQCLPGCQSLERTAESEMVATLKAKVGPVAAVFKGKVTLTDIDAPNGYKIVGEGSGGVAGFAKGVADVQLADHQMSGTILKYAVSAQVGGKLAQIGARLIDATARQMADAFFAKFAEIVRAQASSVPKSSDAPSVDEGRQNAAGEQRRQRVASGPRLGWYQVWVGLGLALALASLVVLTR